MNPSPEVIAEQESIEQQVQNNCIELITKSYARLNLQITSINFKRLGGKSSFNFLVKCSAKDTKTNQVIEDKFVVKYAKKTINASQYNLLVHESLVIDYLQEVAQTQEMDIFIAPVIPVLSVSNEDEILAVLEYLHHNITNIVNSNNNKQEKEIKLYLIEQIALKLDLAARNGVVVADFKLDQVFVVQQEQNGVLSLQVKIIDWGGSAATFPGNARNSIPHNLEEVWEKILDFRIDKKLSITYNTSTFDSYVETDPGFGRLIEGPRSLQLRAFVLAVMQLLVPDELIDYLSYYNSELSKSSINLDDRQQVELVEARIRILQELKALFHTEAEADAEADADADADAKAEDIFKWASEWGHVTPQEIMKLSPTEQEQLVTICFNELAEILNGN